MDQVRARCSAGGEAVTQERLKVLSVTTLFPSPGEPLKGLFVERRLAALARKVDLVVLAAIPSFPLVHRLMARYAYRSKIPSKLERQDMELLFPRYVSIPVVLKPTESWTLARTIERSLRRLERHGFVPDLIDAHLAVPDGSAALLVKKATGLPVTVTLRGHDVNELPRYPVRGRQVRRTLAGADRIFAVAEALRLRAIELGADPCRTVTSPNGVDPECFYPRDRDAARRELGLSLDGELVLSVGYLIHRKGFDHAIRGLAGLLEQGRSTRLVIVGGPGGEAYARPELESLIDQLGVHDRVQFVEPQSPERLSLWYAACDVFALFSSKEGRPNVVIEALACGRPVVATRAWGIPELVHSDQLGVLVPSPPTAEQATSALALALERNWSSEALVGSVAQRSWDAVADQLVAEMEQIRARPPRPATMDGQADHG